MMQQLEKAVRENYADILNRDIVKDLVDNLQIKYPALITGKDFLWATERCFEKVCGEGKFNGLSVEDY